MLAACLRRVLDRWKPGFPWRATAWPASRLVFGFAALPAAQVLLGSARDYRVGWRLTPAATGAPDSETGLDSTRCEAANDNSAEYGVMLRSLLRW